MKTLQKTLLSTAVAATLALGMISQASALPGVFEVSPNGLTGITGYTPFEADQIAGTSSALLTNTSTTTQIGEGWINFTSFTYTGQNVLAGASGINLGGSNSYNLFLTYTQSSTLLSGTINGTSTGILTSLDYTLWADVGNTNIFQQANALGATAALRAASVTDTGNADIKLATGQLISGVNGINALGGAFFNSVNDIALTAAGDLYFTKPIPFFEIAFSQFNNTTQGILFSADGTYVSINQETGSVDFNKIPEPASLALVGLGLLGMGAARRRKTAA